MSLCNAARGPFVSGWIQSLRSHKSTHFLLLNDGSSCKDVQVISSKPFPSFLTLGTAVRITGKWVQSPAKGQDWELLADDIKVLGACGSGYPLVKARVSFDHLREHLHLRSRAKTFQSLWRLRHQAIRGISDFFHVLIPKSSSELGARFYPNSYTHSHFK